MWYKLKKIYVGTNQVRPNWWQPWANTVAYYPLEANTNDATWNYNLTPTDITYTTLSSWLKVATFNWSSSKAETSSFTTATWDYTTSMRVYGDNIQSTLAVMWGNATSDSAGRLWDVYYTQKQIRALIQPNGYIATGNNYYQNNTWYNLVVISSWWDVSVYINNNLIETQHLNCSNYSNMYLGYRQYSNDRFWKGYISRVIIENVAWISQEVSDYYDLTKWDYWIS